ncbi:TonB-dependent receptor [Algoriphagus sp.]|uniref:TonB-dependent receptor domain-containing protein n=1 Tax=Algoriphagus sp. TaxID=1872435 RepID=UPI00261BCEDD|nr:TonB-dependent receptor [Algoriphagus sp.]
MKRFQFILIILVYFFSISLKGQGIKGEVGEVGSEVPLEFASIALFDQADSSLVDGTITDRNGVFEILNIKEGPYFLRITFIGYKTKEISDLQLHGGSLLDIGFIFLEPDQKVLDGVEVQGQQITSDFRLDKQSYSAESFESARGGTASDLLQNLPGITMTPESGLTIRGSSGFVVMINGKPVQSDPLMILSQLPANSIEKVEWISSPSAKYDSEGKGGMINITTKKGATDGLFVQFNGRLGVPSIENYDNKAQPKRFGGDFNLYYVAGKWDFSLGASYQRNDQSGRRVGEVFTVDGDTTTFFPSEGERSFDEKNYSGRFTVGFNPNEANSFSLGFYGGVRDRLRTADIVYFDNHAIVGADRIYTMQYFNANDQNRRGDFALGSLDYTRNFGNGASLTASILLEYTLLGGPTINWNLGFPDTDLVYQNELNTNNNPLNGFRVNMDYHFKPSKIGQFQAGYQLRSLDHRGDFVYERQNLETGIFELLPEFSSEVNLNRDIHAGYVQLDGKKQKWNYGLGIRTEFMNRNLRLKDKAGTLDSLYPYDFIRPFLSGNLAFQMNEGLQIKANFTQRVERTTTFKMNPFPEREHSETLEQGDPNLLPEFINLVDLGVIKNWEDNSFYLTAYHSRIKNLVNRVNTVYTDTILNRIYSNVGTAKSFGFDSGLEIYPASWWKLFAGLNAYQYSISGSFDKQPIQTKTWVFSSNFTSTFTLPKNWVIQTNLNYLSARVTAQGEDGRFYSPNLSVKRSWMEGKLTATVLWQHMDLGLLRSNEQRITTFRPQDFFTTTNYIYEVDRIILNLTYSINGGKNRAKFVKSEFGEQEF